MAGALEKRATEGDDRQEQERSAETRPKRQETFRRKSGCWGAGAGVQDTTIWQELISHNHG